MVRPGSYGVVHLPNPVSRLVSWGTRSWANHAFIVIENDLVVEAWVPHARIRPLSDYNGYRTEFSNDRIGPRTTSAICRHARAAVGQSYGYSQFASLALGSIGLAGPARFLPTLPSTAICSRLVALAGLAGGLDWTSGLPLELITPATLQKLIVSRETERKAA